MRYGLEIIPFGAYSDPRAVVRLAQAAGSDAEMLARVSAGPPAS